MQDVIQGTPVWVYLLFFVLTYYGVMSLFKTVETKFFLWVKLACVLVFSIVFLDYNYERLTVLLMCFCGGVVGAVVGCKVRFYRVLMIEKGRLVLVGSCKVLILYWCIFAINYFKSYLSATGSPLADLYWLDVVLVALSGFFSGVLIGRDGKLLRFLYTAQRNEAVH